MATDASILAVIRASRPSFRNQTDKLAFALHAAFLSAGYSLIAAGSAAFSDNLSIDGEEVGIEGWNEAGDVYGFVYRKSGKAVLMKCLGLGDSCLMVDVAELNKAAKEPLNLQIDAKDYLSEGGENKSNYAEMYKNLEGLVKNLNAAVFDKLEPTVKNSSSASGAERSAHITTTEPAGMFPGDCQSHQPGIAYPPVLPHGGSDAFPGPGAGIYPERGSGIGGGSMLVGPNDPRWFGNPQPGFLGGIPGVPPGARFDPYGPPDVPGFEPGRYIRQPRPPGGGAHPDLEHFQGPDYYM